MAIDINVADVVLCEFYFSLISSGQHDVSVGIIYQSFSKAMPSTHQERTTFSADVEAGHRYFLQGEFSSGVDGELSFDGRLVEASAGEVVRESENLMAPSQPPKD